MWASGKPRRGRARSPLVGGGGAKGNGVALGGDEAVTDIGVGNDPRDDSAAGGAEGAEELGVAEGEHRSVGPDQPDLALADSIVPYQEGVFADAARCRARPPPFT